jgi:excisionase family DNA binding protein
VRLLTVRELAELLAVPERTVYRLAGEGLPGSFRVRRSWRFDPDRVLAALEAPHADGREGKR